MCISQYSVYSRQYCVFFCQNCVFLRQYCVILCFPHVNTMLSFVNNVFSFVNTVLSFVNTVFSSCQYYVIIRQYSVFFRQLLYLLSSITVFTVYTFVRATHMLYSSQQQLTEKLYSLIGCHRTPVMNKEGHHGSGKTVHWHPIRMLNFSIIAFPI